MFKKLATAAATTGLLLASVVPSFATWSMPSMPTITNDATVKNTVNTSSNTGFNQIVLTAPKMEEHHWSWWDDHSSSNPAITGAGITTGMAQSLIDLGNQVNTNSLDKVGVYGGFFSTPTLISNDASVTNNVNTSSNTGYNGILLNGGGFIGNSSITTGSAGSQSTVTNVVNTNTVTNTTVATNGGDL